MQRPIEASLSQLRSRASSLEAEVQQEQRRPQPDSLRLQELKKRKLAIRDALITPSSEPLHS